ncbi:hypothetical protein NTPn6_09795 [Streptococcus pneumoniae]|nr:hypothetical protein NTPn6_09795 [Streptococcus pneumoniae]
MKQEQDKSIRTVKAISKNVLEVEMYYSSFNPLYNCKKVRYIIPHFMRKIYLVSRFIIIQFE